MTYSHSLFTIKLISAITLAAFLVMQTAPGYAYNRSAIRSQAAWETKVVGAVEKDLEASGQGASPAKAGGEPAKAAARTKGDRSGIASGTGLGLPQEPSTSVHEAKNSLAAKEDGEDGTANGLLAQKVVKDILDSSEAAYDEIAAPRGIDAATVYYLPHCEPVCAALARRLKQLGYDIQNISSGSWYLFSHDFLILNIKGEYWLIDATWQQSIDEDMRDANCRVMTVKFFEEGKMFDKAKFQHDMETNYGIVPARQNIWLDAIEKYLQDRQQASANDQLETVTADAASSAPAQEVRNRRDPVPNPLENNDLQGGAWHQRSAGAAGEELRVAADAKGGYTKANAASEKEIKRLIAALKDWNSTQILH